MIPIVLAAIAALGLVTFLGVLVTARGPLPAQARVFRRRVGAVALFVVVATGAAFLVLRTPVESDTARFPCRPRPRSGAGDTREDEVVSATRFSSAGLPALTLDAADGWQLEWNKAGRKLTATGDGARLLVSTAILTEAVDPERLLAKLAETQRALGFEVGDTFRDRLGDSARRRLPGDQPRALGLHLDGQARHAPGVVRHLHGRRQADGARGVPRSARQAPLAHPAPERPLITAARRPRTNTGSSRSRRRVGRASGVSSRRPCL